MAQPFSHVVLLVRHKTLSSSDYTLSALISAGHTELDPEIETRKHIFHIEEDCTQVNVLPTKRGRTTAPQKQPEYQIGTHET